MKLLNEVFNDYRYLVVAALVAAAFYVSFQWFYAVPLPSLRRRETAELRQPEAA